MSDFLYYCARCNSLVVDTYDNEELECSKCGALMSPLHIDEDQWNVMSNEEKMDVLQRYRIPQPQVQKRRPTPNNNAGSYQYTNQKRVYSANNNNYSQQHSSYSGTKKHSALSIIAFVISLIVLIITIFSDKRIGFLGIIPIIIAIVDLSINKGQMKKGLSIAAAILGALSLLFGVMVVALVSSQIKGSDIEDKYPTKEEFVANCEQVPYDNLARNPNDNLGRMISLDINVMQVMGDDTYRVTECGDLSSLYSNELVMRDARKDKSTRLLQNDTLHAYGRFMGTTKVKRALTNITDEVPVFDLWYMDLMQNADPVQQAIDSIVPSQQSAEENSAQYLQDNELNIDIDDCIIREVDGKSGKDYDDNLVYILILSFENQSNENKIPLSVATIKAFQNGVELDQSFMLKDADAETEEYVENVYKEVRPGGSIKFAVPFVLKQTDDLEIEIRDIMGKKVDRVKWVNE